MVTRRTGVAAASLAVLGLAGGGFRLTSSVPAAAASTASAAPVVRQSPTVRASSSTPGVRRVALAFRDDDRVRLRQKGLAPLSGPGNVAARSDALAAQVASVQSILADVHSGPLVPIFRDSEASLDAEHDRLQHLSTDHLKNKNSFYMVEIPTALATDDLLRRLRTIATVEDAEYLPDPTPAPSPDLTSLQAYATPSSPVANGIGSLSVASVPGATGANVKIVDVEYAWNTTHEDLGLAWLPSALIPQSTPWDPFNDTNHGTAVLGVLTGNRDRQGVSGLVSDAQLSFVNVAYAPNAYNVANAISIAAAHMGPGDVLLVEQQTTGPNGCDASTQIGCVAAEWSGPNYTAIKAATIAGIIVVEAAGNGQQNFDVGAVYGTPFPQGRSDSGAIIVGAGAAGGSCTSPERSRLYFSNLGTRVDLQGWGECVATTGYGTAYFGGPNASYASGFSGTSSAAAIVAGAAAIVSSVAERQGVVMSPQQIRQLLKDSGTPGPSGTQIGPLPNVEKALQAFLPTARITAPSRAVLGVKVVMSGELSSDPQLGALAYAWDLDGDGEFDDSYTSVASFLAPTIPGVRVVRLQVTDAGGATATAAATVEFGVRVDAPILAPSITAVPATRPDAPTVREPPTSSPPDRGPAPSA